MNVIPIPCLKDNYAYLLFDRRSLKGILPSALFLSSHPAIAFVHKKLL